MKHLILLILVFVGLSYSQTLSPVVSMSYYGVDLVLSSEAPEFTRAYQSVGLKPFFRYNRFYFSMDLLYSNGFNHLISIDKKNFYFTTKITLSYSLFIFNKKRRR